MPTFEALFNKTSFKLFPLLHKTANKMKTLNLISANTISSKKQQKNSFERTYSAETGNLRLASFLKAIFELGINFVFAKHVAIFADFGLLELFPLFCGTLAG